MTMSENTYRLAMSLIGKNVQVKDIRSLETSCLTLVQLVPNLPIIGAYLKKMVPKNWMSLPVNFIKSSEDMPDGGYSLHPTKLLVGTASGSGRVVYEISPVHDMDSGDSLGDIYREDIYREQFRNTVVAALYTVANGEQS